MLILSFASLFLSCAPAKNISLLLNEVTTSNQVHEEIKRSQCPKLSRRTKDDTSFACLDRKTNKKHGWQLVVNSDGYQLSMYDQDTLVQFPWLVTKQKSPDWKKIELTFRSAPSEKFARDIIKMYSVSTDRPELHQALLGYLVTLGKESVATLYSSLVEPQPCSPISEEMKCNQGGAGVQAITQKAGKQNKSFYLKYQSPTVYVDTKKVTKNDIAKCQKDCNCPENLDWNDFEMAQHYCKTQGKRLLTETEWLSLNAQKTALNLTDEFEWTASQSNITPANLRLYSADEKSCTNCKNNSTFTVLNAKGQRDLRLGSLGAAFRCATSDPATIPNRNYPLLVTQKPTLKKQPNNGYGDSWYTKDAGYRDKVANWHAQKPISLGLDYQYLDVYMVSDLLWAYHQKYPHITQLYQLGESNQGFPILALRVTDNPQQDEKEPAVLINGAHHGDELMSVLYAMDSLDYILTNSSKRTKRWVTDLDHWFIPLVNPDGNWFTLRHGTGRNVGRKNGRNTDGSCVDSKKEGVDLNRNYPFKWGSLKRGSSPKPDNFYYRGPSPASEPETKAMIELANKYRFVAALTMHTNGTMIISPYTIDGNQSPHPDIPWVLAEELVAYTPLQPNNKNFVVKSNMYPVDGTDQDWHYHTHGTIAYIIEGSHHNPKRLRTRKKSVLATRPIYVNLVKAILKKPSLYGFVVDEQGNPLEAKVTIRQHKFYNKEKWTSRPSDGYFYRMTIQDPECELNGDCLPNRYSIKVEKKGYKTYRSRLFSPKRPTEVKSIVLKKITK